ncbi:hypothetical protein HUK80_02690 [Flavobacterium sp. MAH-1]|uniref:Uncharacterized protein n=1 Tax=Flavobacterium agri TaxID=2743471 RepID=A0A7Y9C5X0_9FLAO|nr:hypothetical protein [Flavobacterium agri]NUY79788.1 hypothetical protein [Flavobacterium agri]NYA69813.1 hypothetical protein [Flavobacterium agri]
MTEKTIAKSALLMAVVVIASIVGYESYLRGQGMQISYDDGSPLWTNQRKEANKAENAVVFVGSSRIKYDLDLATWEAQTGMKAIQLAHVGSNPVPMIEDLANDPNFKGNLVIDVTEPLFFSNVPFLMEKPTSSIKYFHEETLAQQASFEINKVVESQLVFLDKENYALNAKLDRLMIPNREGVFGMPIFPTEFGLTTFDRQTYMTDRFVQDSTQVNVVRNIWGLLMSAKMGPPMTQAQFDGIMQNVKVSVDKIKARGGKVIFVRTPSSGPFYQGECMGFPRQKFWDKLLKVTGCEGIHFTDDPELAKLQCPEFSHLDRSDAVKYTIGLASILQQKQWIPAQKRLLSNLY